MKIAQESPLETERLLLRKIAQADAEDIAEIYSYKEIFRYTNSDVDLSSDSFRVDKTQTSSMIELWENDDDLMCWGIEAKGEQRIIGRIYLHDMIGNEIAGYKANVGYSISPKYWGCGYATEALKEVVAHGNTALKTLRFQTEIVPENIASIKVCEKVGFNNEGVLRKYSLYDNNGNCFKDIVMMALCF